MVPPCGAASNNGRRDDPREQLLGVCGRKDLKDALSKQAVNLLEKDSMLLRWHKPAGSEKSRRPKEKWGLAM